VSFDKWKLVVSTKVLEVKANYSSMHGGFIAVFDMTNEFKLLCTKYVAHFSKDWVQMACLPNGSIVVSDSYVPRESYFLTRINVSVLGHCSFSISFILIWKNLLALLY
jgi:hypothetical protein